MFKIDKDVPIPAALTPKMGKLPFAEMSIGDSFFLPCAVDIRPSRASKVRNAVTFYTKKTPGFRATIRRVEGGVRCWRLE